MFRFWELLIQLATRPIAAIFARKVIGEAEVFTAISRAQSLRAAYDRADALEADGFPNLARELRDAADAISLRPPGSYSLECFDALAESSETPLLNAPETPAFDQEGVNQQTAKKPQPAKSRRRPKGQAKPDGD